MGLSGCVWVRRRPLNGLLIKSFYTNKNLHAYCSTTWPKDVFLTCYSSIINPIVEAVFVSQSFSHESVSELDHSLEKLQAPFPPRRSIIE
jgi:hypothetical protein